MSPKSNSRDEVRVSQIARAWYGDPPPGSRDELEKRIDDLLARAEFCETADELIGLISPHAGYDYSGPTAAHAYRQVAGRKYQSVVLLGPSHYENFGPVAVSSKRYYATLLGEIELDQEFIRELGERMALARVAHDREHSLEIQLPFLQRTLDDFKIVPLMLTCPLYLLGSAALGTVEQLASALASIARDKSVLFVASSDLSHLPDYESVKKFDARTASLVQALAISELVQYMSQEGECRACGDAPMLAMLLTAQQLGADRVRILHLTNSGDVTGLRAPGHYTVGYMAAAVYRSRQESRS